MKESNIEMEEEMILLKYERGVINCVNCVRGRRASYKRRSRSVSVGGFYTSENAGMSSENYVRIIMAESLRFLKEGSSASS